MAFLGARGWFGGQRTNHEETVELVEMGGVLVYLCPACKAAYQEARELQGAARTSAYYFGPRRPASLPQIDDDPVPEAEEGPDEFVPVQEEAE